MKDFHNGFSACALAALLLPIVPASGAAQDRPNPQDSLEAPTIYPVEAIVATAIRLERSAADLAVSINVVGRAELNRRPTRFLLDALAGEPGLQIQQTTAGQGAAFVRALTGSHVLLMVDGVRLNNGTFRQGPSQYLATVDGESVERIEVVRGASSTLYGSDAVGGVVNVVTRRAGNLLEDGRKRGLEGSYAFDGGTRGSRVRLSAASGIDVLGGLEIAAGGSYTSHGNLQPGGGHPRQAPTAFSQWGADVRADLQISPRLRADLGFQHSAFDEVHRYDRYVDFRAPGLPGGGVGTDAQFVFSPQARTLLRTRLELQVDRPWLSALELRISTQEQVEGRTTQGWQSTGNEPPLTPSETIRHRYDGVRSLAFDLQGKSLGVRGGQLDLTYGLEAWDNRTDSHGWSEDVRTGVRQPGFRESGGVQVPTGRFPDASSFRGAASYLFVDWRLGSRFRVQSGGRTSGYWTATRAGDAFGGDVNSRISDLSGELGAIWILSPTLRLHGRAAQAFRAPNLYDLSLIGEVPGGFAIPNPDLGSESSHTLEAGARLASGPFRTDVTVYRIGIEDMIDRALDPDAERPPDAPAGTQILRVMNVGSATVRGVEASLGVDGSIGPLKDAHLQLNGSWTRGTARVARDGGLVDEPLSRVPPPSISGRVLIPFRLGRLGGVGGALTGGRGDEGSAAPRRNGMFEYFVIAAAAQERLGFRDRLDSRIQEGGTPAWRAHSIRSTIDLTRGSKLTVSLENLTDTLYRVHGSGIDSAGRHLLVRLDFRL